MNLLETVTETSKKQSRLAHGWIHLTGVPDVETKRRIGKVTKERVEFSDRPSDWLPLVHVLKAQPLSEATPKRPITYNVRVYNDRPLAAHWFTKQSGSV